MADNSDDILIQVSTDLTTVKRQLRQLGQDITASTNGYGKSFEAFGKSIDQSMTPVQKRINELVGIPVASTMKEWTGALARVNSVTVDHAKSVGLLTTAYKMNRVQMLDATHVGINFSAMLAAGVDPARALLMEWGRIATFFQYTAMNDGGIPAFFKAMQDGALGLVTKYPLVTAAITAASAAAVAYAMVGGNSLKTLDEIVKNHEANIKLLGDAYDQASGKQQKYAALTARSVGALDQKNLQDAKDLLTAQIKGIFDSVYKTIGSGGGSQGPLQRVLQSQFEPFKEALADLAKTNDVKAFIDKIDAIAEINPKLTSARDALHALASAAAETAAAIPGLGQPIDEITNTIDKFDRQMASITSKPLQDALQEIFNKAKDGKLSVDEINDAIALLDRANPSFADVIKGLRSIIFEARGASQAVADAYAATAGGSPNGRHFDRDAHRLDQAVLQAGYNGNQVTPSPAPNREDVGAAADKRAHKATKAPAKTSDDRFFEDIEAIRQRTAALAQETAMVGMSYEAQTKRRAAFDLEQQALKQVREEARKKGDQDWQNAQLTPEQVAKIEEVSDAYAKQAEALRVAQQAQQDFQDWINVGRDATRGFIDDLLDGATAGEAFANVLKKIGDHLLDLAMNSLFGGGNGGFGILGSLLGLGGGGGGFVDGAGGGLGGLLGYDEGGYTGAGGKKQPAGIVHKGEVVWSQDDIRKAGGVAAVEAMRARGGVSAPTMPRLQAPANQNGPGGMRADVRVYVDQDGNWQAAVERISQTNVKAGLAQYDKGGAIRAARDLRVANQRGYIR